MNRFHNKYHRHNHHTIPTVSEPDSSHDPIASPSDPFKGEFHIDGALSAVSGRLGNLTVENNLVVSGNSRFHGNVTIDSPITYVLEHLAIFPKSTTENFYFKISSEFTNQPLAEIYLRGDSVFYVATSKDIGIGTTLPEAKLDVRGNIKGFTVSAQNVNVTSNLNVSGNSYFNTLTTDNTSQIGYLEIGYVPSQHTYLKTLSGNKDLHFYTGNNLNLVMHPNNNNRFTGKVGIGMEPKETFTLNGQMSFRQTGFVLLDNSLNNSLRIITNREKPDGSPSDADQHYFSFTDKGRYIVGDVGQDFADSCDTLLGDHRTTIIDTDDTGKTLSLINFATAAAGGTGPSLDFYRSNGDFTVFLPALADEILGTVKAHGAYQTDPAFIDACLSIDKSASIEFCAANDYTTDSRGAYTIFTTVCATDTTRTAFERVKIDHNGNVGINTIPDIPSTYSYRTPIAPNWKFTVIDYETTKEPAAVIMAGVSATPMMQIIGGEEVQEQVALRLSDRNSLLTNNVNHIEFTQGQTDVSVARVSMTHKEINASAGGSLFFSTTYDTTTPVLPFERARLTPQGDVGVGIKTPNSRLHIHDDNKIVTQLDGTLRDVVTVSTNNNTNGILLSSVALSSRVYNNNTDLDLHIATATTGGAIKFDVDNENFAVVMTSAANVGIGIGEELDTLSLHTGSTVRLGVSGNTMLFNSVGAFATGEGARLYFNKEAGEFNTDPLYMARFDTGANVSELRVNIGNETCASTALYINQDVFSVGNYPIATPLLWDRWMDIGTCSTTIYKNLSCLQDVSIQGTLSVVNPLSAPMKFVGDLYVNGNIFATKNITAFWPAVPGPPGGWPSDERLKLNIVPITTSLEKIILVNGVYFDWNEEKQNTHKGRDVGVVAQEIEKILPEIVHENSEGYKTVQYEKIIPLLIECIKDLKKEIDEIKSK